jgi:hypothetical protein
MPLVRFILLFVTRYIFMVSVLLALNIRESTRFIQTYRL